MALRGSSSWPTTPTCSSTEARRRRRGGTPTARSAARTSASSQSGLEPPAPLVARGAPADAARRDRAGAGGDRAGGIGGHLPHAPVRRGAGGQRVRPDRHEPLERLLGCPARRRHRGPARPGARDGGRPDAASILAGVLYTGGPRPYGYEGLGELFVFLFFGVVAVAGSYFVQTEELRWEAVALGVPVGLLAAAILVVNNVRDIDTDRRADKRTLAVKLGRARARRLFVAMLVIAFLVPVALVPALSAWLLLPLAALPLAPPLVRTVTTRADGPALNAALASTGRLLAVFSLLLAAGVLLS